ncbi:variable surface protein, partial [Plasmodium gonderi]
IYFKYGLCIVATCLAPLLGIILPVLDRIDSTTKHIIPKKDGKGGVWIGGYKSILSVSGIPVEVTYIYIAFFVILSFIILFLIIYVMGKFLKYEQLKAKKEKMFFKEYYDFNKDMFRKRFYYANI